MWLTFILIVLFSGHQIFLFKRKTLFFVHSLFLIPLYATTFFVDHNASRVLGGVAMDATPPVVKMFPIYLSIFLLFRARIPSAPSRSIFTVRVVNFFLMWLFAATTLSGILMASLTPLFIASFTAPLFWLFFNSENVHQDLSRVKKAKRFDKLMLQFYFIGFVSVYVISLYYSIAAGITTSLMDSRSAGSIFASTSAIVYCVLYAPLIAEISGTRYPYWIMAIIGIVSLSKTALFLTPVALVAGYKIFKNHFKRHKFKYLITLFICLISLALFMQTQAFDVLSGFWEEKFDLAGKYSSIFEKAYFTRMKLYKVAIELISRYPTGVGTGNFELFQPWGFKDPHNFILAMLVEDGWVAGGAFIVTLFFVFFRAIIAVIKRAEVSYLHYSIITVFLIYFTSGGVLATTGYPGISVVYYTPLYGAAVFFHLNSFLRRPQHLELES